MNEPMNEPMTTAEETERLSIENEKLRKEVLSLRRFIDSMQNLMDAVENPRPDEEIMGLLSQVLSNALETINAKDGSLLVLDEETEELVFVLTDGEVPHEQLAWRRLPAKQGIAGWVAENRKSTIVNDVQSDDRFYSDVDTDLEFRTTSLLSAPIIGGGRMLGVIEVLNKRDGLLFGSRDQTLLSLMCRFSGELLHTVIQQNDQGKTGATS